MNIAKKTFIICVVLTTFAGVLYFIFLAKVVLIYLLIAILLAIAVNPLVSFFQRHKCNRVWASLLAMLLILVVLGAVVGTIVTPLAIEGTELVQNLPTITALALSNPLVHGFVQTFNLQAELTQLSTNASAVLLGSSVELLVVTRSVISFVSSLFIVLILTLLLSIDGGSLWTRAIQPLSVTHRKNAQVASVKISKAVSGFIIGNLAISAVAAIVTIITLLILRVPYVFALAALIALLDLIPLVGAALATIIIGFVALIKGPIVALIAVAVLITYQFIEGHFIQPVVYSKSVNLSPLFIILVSIIGAEVAGIGGVILAIPLAAIVEIIASELYVVYLARKV